MLHNPENELQEFLAPLPWWMQRVLWWDYSWLDDPSVALSDKLAWIEEGQGREPELRAKFEEILERDRINWNEYCHRARDYRRHEKKSEALYSRTTPRKKSGRKPRTELAERIWKLDSDGKTNREILQILNARGENLSLEAIESYLKTRRKKNR